MSSPMTAVDQARKELTALANLAEQMAGEHADTIVRLAGVYAAALRRGGTLFFAGNGGSAADAQHVAAEYVIRFDHRHLSPYRVRERSGI